jgi:Fe-S-cluster containining protein
MKPLPKVLRDIVRRKDVLLAALRRVMPQVTVSTESKTENPPLNCLKCASFCCKLAGYVEVHRADIKRLAEHFDMTVREFEEKHLVEVTRKGEKLIKSAYDTCQFLTAERKCGVYKARPRNCREYVCWDQYDTTVYDFAYFYQKQIAAQKRVEDKKHAEAARAKEAARTKRRRTRRRG